MVCVLHAACLVLWLWFELWCVFLVVCVFGGVVVVFCRVWDVLVHSVVCGVWRFERVVCVCLMCVVLGVAYWGFYACDVWYRRVQIHLCQEER